MHISLDSALGRQRRLNSVGESVLQIAPDAAAAYSLRSLTGGDPDVVRVRRESDNTEKDFSGSQIESGEMARWVNEQPTLPLDLRELDENTGERDGALIQAAAAYSLRKLKEDYTGDVVEVRRNVDGETEGFTAAEVTDGTLEDFVNASFDDELPLDQATGAAAAYSLRSLGSNQWTYGGDTLEYESDFSAENDDVTDGFGVSGGTIDGNIDNIGDQNDRRNDNLRLTVNSALSLHGYVNTSVPVTEGDEHRISFDYYIPSSNQDLNGIGLSMRGPVKVESAPPLDQWNSFSLTGTPTSTGAWYIYTYKDGNGNFTGNGTDVIYIRNVKVYESLGDTEYLPSGKYVVQVRRSSDDTVKSFTAAEVADGTLEDWVNADVVKYTSDFSAGTDEHTVPTFLDGTVEGNIDNIGSRNDNLRFTVGSTLSNQGCRRGGSLVTGGYEHNLSFDYYIPNSNQDVSGISVNMRGVIKTESAPPLGKWNSFSLTGIPTSNGGWYIYAHNGNTSAFTGNGTDVFYVRNITLTQTTADGHVKTWYDQSGSDNHATQTDPAKQPKIVENGNLLKDSRNNPAIDFDDVDDNMDLTSDLVAGGAYSCIAYHEFNAPTMILKGDLNYPRIRSTGNTNYQVSSYSPIVDVNFTVASTQGLVSFIKDSGNNGRLYANGTESSSGQQAIGSGSAPFTMLGTQVSEGPGDGKLVEVIYYESDQSDKRRAIEENIANHYDITLAAFSRDGTVKTWYDQSGSTPSNDAVQTDAAKQPKIVDGGNLQKDSKNNPAIKFTASDTTSLVADNVAATQAYSAIFKASADKTGASQQIIDGDTSTTSFIQIGNDGVIDINNGTSVATSADLDSLPSDFIFTAIINGSSSNAFFSGSNVLENQNAGSNNLVGLTIGKHRSSNANYYDNQLSELIIYDSDQSDNRTAIEANIGETYGITAIPAANDTVNGYVQTWYDQSGSGNDAEQIAADKQPTIVGEVTSGEPHAFLGAIEFDGTDDELNSPSIDFGDNPNTIFTLVKSNDLASDSFLLSLGQIKNLMWHTNIGVRRLFAGLNLDGGVMSSNQELWSGFFDNPNDTGTLHVNGTQEASGSIGTNVVGVDTIRIGASNGGNPHNGWLKEIIIYNSDQSANRPAIETNIANQYGITLS